MLRFSKNTAVIPEIESNSATVKIKWNSEMFHCIYFHKRLNIKPGRILTNCNKNKFCHNLFRVDNNSTADWTIIAFQCFSTLQEWHYLRLTRNSKAYICNNNIHFLGTRKEKHWTSYIILSLVQQIELKSVKHTQWHSLKQQMRTRSAHLTAAERCMSTN